MSNNRALIVGNANIPIPPGINPADYAYVAVFNSPRKPELFPFCTHHFMRGGRDGLFASDPRWEDHRGKVCIVGVLSSYNYGKDIIKRAGQSGRTVKDIRVETYSPPGYPKNKRPSTGLIAILHFLKFNVPCDLACFTWEGVDAHAWEWEADYCAKLAHAGKIRIPGQGATFTEIGKRAESSRGMVSLLTCTGDRPECLRMLRRNLERQTAAWDKASFQWVIVDDGAESSELEGCSLPVVYVRRQKADTDPAHTLPVQLQAANPHVMGGAVLMAEDDDYYLPGWFDAARQEIGSGLDLYGEGAALYYHVGVPGTMHHNNRQHCSLAATAMSARGWSALNDICRKSPQDPCVDIALWKFGRGCLASKIRHPGTQPLILQMKGMPGRKGTLASHRDTSRYHRDDGLSVLRSMIVAEDLPFYLGIVEPAPAAGQNHPAAPAVAGQRLGVMFPCSDRESDPSDIVDIANFYRKSGFDRIVIVNNRGMECLREMIPFAQIVDDFRHPAQNDIMLDAAKYMQDCDWVLFCDSDEYLWQRESLREYLAQMPADIGAVAISWQCFGWAGEQRNGTPSPQLSIDRMPNEADINRHVKVVARPQAITGWAKGPHLPELAAQYHGIMPSGKKIATVDRAEYRSHKQDHESDRFTLAHFYYRSQSDARRKERHNNLFNGTPKRPNEIEYVIQNCTEHDETFRSYYHAIFQS